MSLWDMFTRGGSMMIPILICSIIAVVIFLERYLSLRKIRINSRKFTLQIRSLLSHQRVDEAILLCKETPGPIAGVAKAALVMGILATVAGVAPMFGFLGTVTGMIKAFMQIQSRGGNVDASVLAGGIWEALITTAAGLAVGIPALIAYNWIQGKVEHHVFEMQESSNEFLDMLQDKEA